LAHDAGSRRDRDDESRALGAHDRKYRAGDVHRAEQGGLDLGAEVLRADLLEEPGVEVARVVDEDVDPAEALDGRLHGRLGVVRAGDVQLDDQQILGLADGLGHRVGVTAGRDDSIPSGKRRFGDVHP
jgi:hypothetical protein